MKDNERDLGRQINYAHLLFRRNFDSVVAAESAGYTDSLSGRNLWVLRYLEEHRNENVYQRDLEYAFKVRRSTVSKTVELMEQKGLLVREAVNGDARLKRLCLTPKAEEILARVSSGVARMEEQLKNAFSPADYETFLRLLKDLCCILEALPESAENNPAERNDPNKLC